MSEVLVLARRHLCCNQCGYNWYSKLIDRPIACPHCKSGKWDGIKREPKGELLKMEEVEIYD